MVELRQGCISSPCFSSSFVKDLPQYFERGGAEGVKLAVLVVRVLTYADDGALVAESPELGDLQCMVEIPRLFCRHSLAFVG